MPQFVIEREIPGAGNLSDAELQAVAKKLVGVIKDMGPEIKVAPLLRHGRQDLLCVPGTRRGDRSRTRAPQRLSGESRLGSAPPDRSRHGRLS